MNSIYPFSAIVDQDELKTALILLAVNPSIGGLLIRGDKGTAKSTAARGLSDLLMPILRNRECPFNCYPDTFYDFCRVCSIGEFEPEFQTVPFVDLPIGATEDRVLGSIDLEQAVKCGKQVLKPGILAGAHRGILYLDEVNLLPDHLVDLLLDCAASGVNKVERDGISCTHPAQFVLVGTMNPEEGELRPQFLDRFGMVVDVKAPEQSQSRYEIVKRRVDFDSDPLGFRNSWQGQEDLLRRQIADAINVLDSIKPKDSVIKVISELCTNLQIKSLRADLTIFRGARALAALRGHKDIELDDIKYVARLVLSHRLRTNPFESPGQDSKIIDEALSQFQSSTCQDPGKDDSHSRDVQESIEQDLEEPASDVEEDRESESHKNAPMPEAEFRAGEFDASIRLKTDISDTKIFKGRRSLLKNSPRGYTVRADRQEKPEALALNETIVSSLVRNTGSLDISSEDFHGKVKRSRNGNLLFFVVDASGSMGAFKRMETVKGAIRILLDDAYQMRDEVAVITFRGREASLLVEPTSDLQMASKLMEGMPTGGRTPLASAFKLTISLLDRYSHKGSMSPLVVMLTDGKCNYGFEDSSDPLVDLGSVCDIYQKRGFPTLVIDTESSFVRMGKASSLARNIGAQYVLLDSLSAYSLAISVRSSLKRMVGIGK